jgi:hypothetical protein
MGSSRIKSVRQRLAYTGKHFIKPKGTTNETEFYSEALDESRQYTQRLDKVQKEFETMRPEILERKHGKDMGKYSVPGLNDYGSLCVDEATCGASSSALWNKLIESGFTSKQVQVVNGGYTGPGAEFSGAGISSGGKPFVGHAWLRLDDGTIIDGSAGQFMHQGTAPIERVKGKHDTKEHYEEKYSTEETREPKQKNRLRIIPPDSKLQKYYEPWFTEHPLTGRRKWFDKKNPMRKEIKKAEGSLKRIEERERAHRVAPKSARIQTARQRLADIFDVIEGGSVERIKRQPNLGGRKSNVRMSPRRFLDLAGSTGLETRSKRPNPKRWQHNTGVLSDLGDEYTGDPTVEGMSPTTGAMWYEGEQYRMPKKYYIKQDKEGNYTKDMHKYIDDNISDDGYYMEGVDERDFIDEDTPPTTYEGKPITGFRATDTRNKILGTGEDLTLVGPDVNMLDDLRAKGRLPEHEIFRGDETGGTVEYFRRKLRRGEAFEGPSFQVDDEGNITAHEGRHRARAMFDEDVKDFPVSGSIGSKNIPLSKIKGEHHSLDRKRADLKVNEALTGNKITIPRKDTRYPILGRYSKSARIQMARERLGGLGFRERILNWLKEQPRFKSFDPDSSFVGTVKYDQDNQSMQIELNGKKYDFCNVEERLFDSFSGAGSKGAFFNREIKSLHNCGAW